MRVLPFFKMSGSGNDFLIMDNRSGLLNGVDLVELARHACRRHESVGADGLIVIEAAAGADFKWQFFNSDGSVAAMCANGGRCAARYAFINGIAGPTMRFLTGAGMVEAEVRGSVVKLGLTQARGLKCDFSLGVGGEALSLSSINAGVPHAILFVDDVEKVDVGGLGRAIRWHEQFGPEGTNVDFVQVKDRGRLAIRTYERGVEGETLACGTGAVAAALVAAWKGMVDSPVWLHTRGGEILTVYFEKSHMGFEQVHLEGEVRAVCQGELWDEALR